MKTCIICKKELKEETKEGKIPLCSRKKCIKKFVRIFGRFCKGVDEEAGMETNGFMYNGKLIRHGHFEEDFERIWKEGG